MPFKSQAQSRAAFSGALGPEMKDSAKEWADKTDYDSLPDKVESVNERELSVPERHQLKIAYDTLKMPDAMVGVMGGPDKEESREIIKRLTGKTVKEESMAAPLTVRLLEAIRKKNWHEANTLFERAMQARVIARVNDIKTRVMMEDANRCELCGSTKNVTMVDGTPLCAKCDPESDLDECSFGMKKEDFGATKVCKGCKHAASEHGDDGCDHSGCKCTDLTEADLSNTVEKGDQTGGNVGPQQTTEDDQELWDDGDKKPTDKKPINYGARDAADREKAQLSQKQMRKG